MIFSMRKNTILTSLLIGFFVITFQATAATQTPYLNSTLSYGTTNSSDVLLLQKFLNAQGLLASSPTGNFLSATKQAVIAFQKSNNIPQTGNVDTVTRGRINTVAAATLKPAVPAPTSSSQAQTPLAKPFTGQKSISATPPAIPAALTVIAGCGTVSQPGTFTIPHDITSVSGQTSCLTISNTTGVSIDCRGHKISGDPFPLSISNSSNIKLTSCVFDSSHVATSTKKFDVGVNIVSGNGISFLNSTFNARKLSWFTIDVQKSSNVTLSGSTVYGEYKSEHSTGSLVKNNVFITPNLEQSWPQASVTFEYGSSNQAIGNTMDGHTPVKASTPIGADDGVFISNENSDIVQDNSMKNVFDCGLEVMGKIQNLTFSNNKVENAAICGIGGWYSLSMSNSTFANNTIIDTPIAFTFYRIFGIMPGDTALFTDNVFSGNTYSTTKYFAQPSFFLMSPTVATADIRAAAGLRAMVESDFIVHNNVFTNNKLGSNSPAPIIWPISMATNGGGNTCWPDQPVNSGYDYMGRYPFLCVVPSQPTKNVSPSIVR